MHLVPAVRYIVSQHKRNHIAQAVSVHGPGFQHINLTFRHPCGQKRRCQPAATPKAQRWPFFGKPLDLLAFDILFWTGCREGEMLALLPKDLTDDDQLRIYKTYHRKKGQDIFGPTKNSKKGGNRNVPIPHWLAEEFRTYCSRLYGLTPDDRVFYMTCTALNKELTRCTQLTYLPDIRVHDLRHSHVSLCIELGYSIVLVAKRIGDTVPVVMRTYAHLYPNKQQELVSKLEAIGSPTSNNDDSDLMSLG